MAYSAAANLAREGVVKIDSWQMRALGQSCRAAKEKLLSEGSPEEIPVSVLGRGSSLIGGTIKTNLVKQEIESCFAGIFPSVSFHRFSCKGSPVWSQEFGLGYESDAAITKHLARFLRRGGSMPEDLHIPTAVFFNGGVMKADALRKRIIEVINSWGGLGVREIESSDLDLSVAIGAAFYGFTKKTGSVRIRGGLAKDILYIHCRIHARNSWNSFADQGSLRCSFRHGRRNRRQRSRIVILFLLSEKTFILTF